MLSLVNQSASFSLMLLTVNLEATPDNFLKSFQSNFIQFPKKEAPIILLFMAILLNPPVYYKGLLIIPVHGSLIKNGPHRFIQLNA